MDKVIEILEDLRPDIDFNEEKQLIDGGIITSFDVISIVGELNEHFNVDIDAFELIPENFNSAEAIWNLVQKDAGRRLIINRDIIAKVLYD